MLALEIKILILTGVYFIGWFLFEKVASRLWNKYAPATDSSTANRRRSPQGKPAAAPVLATVTPLDQTARYLKGLKSPDWRIRRISCIQLADKRGSAVVQGLIDALKDPREEVSLAAGESLTKIGDPAAIAALTTHVQHLEKNMEESYERYRAA